MENRILVISFDFSFEIIALYKILLKHSEFVLSKQLLRSATSIGANVEEGNATQSKRDFIAKMSIASKKARETRYWLRLLGKSEMVQYDYPPYPVSIEAMMKVLTKIVKTSQQSIAPI